MGQLSHPGESLFKNQSIMINKKATLLVSSLSFAAALLVAPAVFAAATPAADSAKSAYPLTTCVVSGDKLEGDMGGPVDYIHKEAGKPDRLVRFCCKDCVKDFKKDPPQYLKKIDAAAIAKVGHPAEMK